VPKNRAAHADNGIPVVLMQRSGRSWEVGMATRIGARMPGPGLRAPLEPAGFGISQNRSQSATATVPFRLPSFEGQLLEEDGKCNHTATMSIGLAHAACVVVRCVLYSVVRRAWTIGSFRTSSHERDWTQRERMAKGKKPATEQLVNLLRQIGRTIWRAKTCFGTGEIF
jgi:hypothetical protein